MRAGLLDWAPALLLACVLGYGYAYLSVRSFIPCAFIVLAAPLPLVLRLARWPLIDRGNAIAIALMLALVAWMLVQLAWATPLTQLGTGRASLYGAALALAIAVGAGRLEPDALFPMIGMGAFLALVVSVHGVIRFEYDGYGLGNPNHLLNACAPAQIAWAAFLIVRACQGRPARAWQYVAAAAFTILLWYEVYFAIPGYPRRGVIAATAVAGAGVAVLWLWRARPRLAALVVAAGFAAAAVLAAWVIAHPPEDARSERYEIYRAAAQAGLEALPWGGGSYATMRFEDFHGEAVRHLLATNVWMTHSHCELLEELLCGGIVGLALSVAWAAAMAWRAVRIIDGAQRSAAIAAGLALLVHVNTDNAYSLPACIGWAGVLLGAIMRCPAALPEAPARWLRPLAVGLATLTAAAAVREIPATILARDCQPEQRVAAIRASAMADFDISQWADAMDQYLNAQRLDEAADFCELLRRRVAGASNTGYAQCIVWSRLGERERAACGDALARLAGGQPSAALEVMRASEAAARADTAELAATLRYLHRSPFNRLGYDHLDQILSRRPDLIPLAPQADIVRLRYRRGDRGLPPPVWSDPASIDDAADLFAGVMWAHQRGWPAEKTGPGLELLLKRYGDVPDCSLLAVEMLRDLPRGSFPWLESRRDALVHASEKVFPADRVRLLESVQTPEQAAAVWTALTWIYPTTTSSLVANRMNYLHDRYDPIWSNLARIWGLRRRAAGSTP